jgi:hypothetical protein
MRNGRRRPFSRAPQSRRFCSGGSACRRQRTATSVRRSQVGSKKEVLRDKSPDDRERWSLSQFVEVASELSIIKEKTLLAARLCNDYRNLIHPGRARRLGEKCNRGTALLTVAALEHVVADLLTTALDIPINPIANHLEDGAHNAAHAYDSDIPVGTDGGVGNRKFENRSDGKTKNSRQLIA